jgi:hypothetical protein
MYNIGMPLPLRIYANHYASDHTCRSDISCYASYCQAGVYNSCTNMWERAALKISLKKVLNEEQNYGIRNESSCLLFRDYRTYVRSEMVMTFVL